MLSTSRTRVSCRKVGLGGQRSSTRLTEAPNSEGRSQNSLTLYVKESTRSGMLSKKRSPQLGEFRLRGSGNIGRRRKNKKSKKKGESSDVPPTLASANKVSRTHQPPLFPHTLNRQPVNRPSSKSTLPPSHQHPSFDIEDVNLDVSSAWLRSPICNSICRCRVVEAGSRKGRSSCYHLDSGLESNELFHYPKRLRRR